MHGRVHCIRIITNALDVLMKLSPVVMICVDRRMNQKDMNVMGGF